MAEFFQWPRISIVVPSYNQGRFLPDALSSIFRQEYPNAEIVVMDGGSTDESVEVIRRHASRLKYWQSQPDGGQSAAINAGMKHASGDVVAWLNSDDQYCDEALWHVARAYRAHPEHGLYIGNGFRLDETGRGTPFCSRHVAMNRAALLHGTDFLLQPAVFFLREAWDRVGGLDALLNYCMDWDIFLRVAQSYPCVLINEFLAVSREYADTKTSSGKMKRAMEILCMISRHAKREITPGSLLYLLETLPQIAGHDFPGHFAKSLEPVVQSVARKLSFDYGGGHGFPERSDPQDSTYIPRVGPDRGPALPQCEGISWPSVSIVIPAKMTYTAQLERTEKSLRNQHYPNLEILVVERKNAADGLARAVNRGLRECKGEIVGWLMPGDELTVGAVHAAARTFAGDNELDWLVGNALHVDAHGTLTLVEDASCRSAFWIGPGAPRPMDEASLLDIGVDTVAGRTLFFRRSTLDRSAHQSLSGGRKSPGDGYAFKRGSFVRLTLIGKGAKLERTQTLCRAGWSSWRDGSTAIHEFAPGLRPRPRRMMNRAFATWRSVYQILRHRIARRIRNRRERILERFAASRHEPRSSRTYDQNPVGTEAEA